MVNPDAWNGRKVLVTGHTGFKGSWLAHWLLEMGANVVGYALAPQSDVSLFNVLRLGDRIDTYLEDINDLVALNGCVESQQPDVVFHLAAQSLVRTGYQDPAGTLSTNIMGTANLLEAVRQLPNRCRVVVVTSDKCYRNDESGRRYDEEEPLGGHDPYSASKAAAEIVAASYRNSFAGDKLKIASARAGNVIGGGDWAEDRLVPDLVRAWTEKRTLQVRHPEAIRPWQHVLEPISGYLLLAEQLGEPGIASAWNFGPDADDVVSVGDLLQLAAGRWPELSIHCQPDEGPHEAATLLLDSQKACTQLSWRPRWRLEEALDRTLDWYQAWREGRDMLSISSQQIADYLRS